jgi:hypothetical protein
MSVQDFPTINQLAVQQHSPEHVWGMALYSFISATEAICELAKKQPHLDMAVEDLDKIAGAALAVNVMWAHLKRREAA